MEARSLGSFSHYKSHYLLSEAHPYTQYGSKAICWWVNSWVVWQLDCSFVCDSWESSDPVITDDYWYYCAQHWWRGEMLQVFCFSVVCWEGYRCLLLLLFDAKEVQESRSEEEVENNVWTVLANFATSSTTNMGKLKHKPAIDARGCSCAKCAHRSSASSTAAEARGSEQFYCSARSWLML